MPEKEVVNNPEGTVILLEYALGLLGSLYGFLGWRVFKSVSKDELESMEKRFDKKVDDLKKDLTDDTKVLKADLKSQITEYKDDAAKNVTVVKEDAARATNEVKKICSSIFDKINKRKGD